MNIVKVSLSITKILGNVIKISNGVMCMYEGQEVSNISLPCWGQRFFFVLGSSLKTCGRGKSCKAVLVTYWHSYIHFTSLLTSLQSATQ